MSDKAEGCLAGILGTILFLFFIWCLVMLMGQWGCESALQTGCQYTSGRWEAAQ